MSQDRPLNEAARWGTSGTARRSRQLLAEGVVAPDRVDEVERVSAQFAMAVSRAMLGAINRGDPNDPIARQFVPRADELEAAAEELEDPIGDERFSPLRGIVHRYPDRVLLKPLHSCPVYCRFCFRREQVGPGGDVLSDHDLQAALDYVREHREIWEVILTGGDPLVLSARRLQRIIRALDAVAHVEVIRIHTRVPLVAPALVSPERVEALKVVTPVYVVLHCNHAREFTDAGRAACAALVDCGIPMLSQSVLLKGVNDDPESMAQLLRALVKARVKPYYLHHLDLARGTGHFRVSVAEGQALMRRLRGRISGLCQPTYVLDIPGGHGKVPIGPVYLERSEEMAGYVVEDYQGGRHVYRDPAANRDLSERPVAAIGQESLR